MNYFCYLCIRKNHLLINNIKLCRKDCSFWCYTAVTNTTGRFSINGMRTGGPYEVTVSYIGFQPKTLKGITLQLAETYNLAVWLSEDANELAEVIVSGKASKFAAEKTGAATNITSAQITNLPTVSRSITDVTRLSPYGGNGMSFAGADGRTANFTVDGANFNNNFGLNLYRRYRGVAGGDLALRCSSDQLHRWWCKRHYEVGYKHLQGQCLRIS